MRNARFARDPFNGDERPGKPGKTKVKERKANARFARVLLAAARGREAERR